jgi:parallel beta-helix repeat protein
VIIRDNATQGLSVGVGHVTVDHVESSANGMTGMHASGANGLVIEHSLITGNDTQHFNSGPSAGGIKVGRMNGVTIDANYVHDNLGIDPIWTDEDVTNFVITNNVAVASGGAQYGIITELSDTGVIAGNTVSDAWYGYTAYDTGHVRVYNNTFFNNSVWDIGLSQDNRYQPGKGTAGVGPTPACPWIVNYVDVANNDVSGSTAMYEFYALDKQTGRTADVMHITLHGNLFRTRVSSGPWAIGWGNGDPWTPTNYASPQAWASALGLPNTNAAITTANPAAPDMSDVLVPVPSDIATMIGIASGAEHLGAF